MCDNWLLSKISIKYLPREAWNRLADILDPENGDISMEIFAQNVDLRQNHKLLLTTDKLRGYRCGYRERPTIVLLDFLAKRGISVGLIKDVLDRMGADTAHIFEGFKQRMLNSYYAGIFYSGESTGRQTQSYCPCRDCQTQNRQPGQADSPSIQRHQPGQTNPHSMQRHVSEQSRLPGQGQQTGTLRPNLEQGINSSRVPGSYQPPNALGSNNHPGLRSQSQEDNEHQDWYPPMCSCERSSCVECDERRLNGDPEETVVISAASRFKEYRVLASQHVTSRTNQTASIAGTNNDDDSEKVNDIRYTENPSNSWKLNATPYDGPKIKTDSLGCTNNKSSSKDIPKNKDELKCTCVVSTAPPVCSCKPKTELQSLPTSLTKLSTQTGTSSRPSNLNRWSTGSPYVSSPVPLCTCGTTKSASDKDVRYPSYTPKQMTGRRLLISYTDDVSGGAEDLAYDLKQEGHKVTIDIQKSSFSKAYDQGLVSEPDQCVWLKEMYWKADYIIVCSSKGYKECLNLQSVCPSPKYLNARFIRDLILGDPKGSQKVIQLCFNASPYEATWSFPFLTRFLIPRELYRLKLLIDAGKKL